MKILKWYTEEECKDAISEFLDKFYSDTLSIKDTYLFFKTLFGVIYRSKELKIDEGIKEIWDRDACCHQIACREIAGLKQEPELVRDVGMAFVDEERQGRTHQGDECRRVMFTEAFPRIEQKLIDRIAAQGARCQRVDEGLLIEMLKRAPHDRAIVIQFLTPFAREPPRTTMRVVR